MRMFARKPRSVPQVSPPKRAKPCNPQPESRNAGFLLGLQGTIGNRAVQRLLRTAGRDDGSSGTSARRPPELAALTARIKPIPSIENRLAARENSGDPLPAPTRRRMENAFGYDFSRVRVHRDSEAGEISRQVSAHAFTHGNHVYFGSGRYEPSAPFGKHLLAHELAHVVQQGYAARLPNPAGAPALPSVGTAPPGIQRFSYFEGGSVHETNNLADTVLYEKDVGNTILLLNDKVVTKSSEMRAALKRPTLSFAPVASGGFDATVKSVPINKARYDETVLAARRWTLDVPKSKVLEKFPSLTRCKGKGRTTFRAFGMPSEGAMFAASRRHENHHADSYISAFLSTIWPWDTNLDIAGGAALLKDPSGTYHGKTKAEAEAALWKAMGGTPDEIADKYADAAAAAIDDYHSKPEGGTVSWDEDTAEADERCTTSSVECTNPS